MKRGSKSVRFSSELETHHVIDVSDTTPSVPAPLQWNDVNTAYEQFIKVPLLLLLHPRCLQTRQCTTCIFRYYLNALVVSAIQQRRL